MIEHEDELTMQAKIGHVNDFATFLTIITACQYTVLL